MFQVPTCSLTNIYQLYPNPNPTICFHSPISLMIVSLDKIYMPILAEETNMSQAKEVSNWISKPLPLTQEVNQPIFTSINKPKVAFSKDN